MKKGICLFLLFIYSSCFSQINNDTITSWQIYKDTQLLHKSNSIELNNNIINIQLSDNFQILKFYINSDMRTKDIRRKLLFKQNGKLEYSFIRSLKSNNDPFIISNTELKEIFESNLNKEFIIEFTDDTSPCVQKIGVIKIID